MTVPRWGRMCGAMVAMRPTQALPSAWGAYPHARSCGALGLPAFAQPLRRGGACRAAPPPLPLPGGADPTEVGRQRKVRSAERVPRYRPTSVLIGAVHALIDTTAPGVRERTFRQRAVTGTTQLIK